jgi:hypothetical protein
MSGRDRGESAEALGVVADGEAGASEMISLSTPKSA